VRHQIERVDEPPLILVDLRERGLDVTRPILVVIVAAEALAAAVRAVFERHLVQRCQLHKIRNVQRRLPDAPGATVAKKMRAAYRDPDPLVARAGFEALARDLERSHPGAAGSLREFSSRHSPSTASTFHRRWRARCGPRTRSSRCSRSVAITPRT